MSREQTVMLLRLTTLLRSESAGLRPSGLSDRRWGARVVEESAEVADADGEVVVCLVPPATPVVPALMPPLLLMPLLLMPLLLWLVLVPGCEDERIADRDSRIGTRQACCC